MARTRNNRLIGAAAHAQKRDDLQAIITADAIHREALRKRTAQACQSIADRTTAEDYAAWWKTTPDDDEGFYRAAVDKLSELETAEIIAWLTPSPTADYDLPTPVIISGGEILEVSPYVPQLAISDDDKIPF